MKKLITILALLVSTYTFATKHYFSSSTGNDITGTGTTVLPWASLAKASTALSTDTVYFKAGDTFAGQLKPASNSTTFDSYGVGANPIISGFISIPSWTLVSGSIYKATPNAGFKPNHNCNVLTINGVPQAVGRTPNVGSYFTYSGLTTTTITSASFAGAFAVMKGAEVVMKNNSYSASKGTITSQSGTTLTYARTYAIDNAIYATPSPTATTNYGCFLQRFVGSLDQQGEWYYNDTTNEVRMFSSVNPSTLNVKMSYVDTLVNLSTRTGIKLNHLTLEGASVYAVFSSSSTDLVIRNCSFLNNTRGVHMWFAHHPIIDSNYFKHSFNNAIVLKGQSTTASKQMNITNNYIDSTGMLIGMGLQWSDYNLKAVIAFTTDSTAGGNYVNITGNTIKNTGYSGIQFQGSNVTIRRNIVDSFCSKLQDGGGIYTFSNNQSLETRNFVNRLIDSNFISNALGGFWGTAGDLSIDVVGAYDDDQAAHTNWLHNTIWNIPGPAMQMNTPHDNIFRDNVVYNCTQFMSLNKRHVAEVYNNFIDNNIFYQKLSTQLAWISFDDGLNAPTSHTYVETIRFIAAITDNYISDRSPTGYTYYYDVIYGDTATGYTGPNNISLATWQASPFFQGAGSILPPLTLTNSNTAIYTNPTSSASTKLFTGARKMAPDGTVYDNSITLAPFSSMVLIDDGTAPISGTTRTFYIRRLP